MPVGIKNMASAATKYKRTKNPPPTKNPKMEAASPKTVSPRKMVEMVWNTLESVDTDSVDVLWLVARAHR